MKLTAVIAASVLIMIAGSAPCLSAAEVPASDVLTPVVSTAWLAEHVDDPDLVILHIGPPDSYEKGHIPGARSASLRRLIRVDEAGIRDEMVSVEDMGKAFSELGISENSRIVIYFAEEGIAWGVARYLLTLEYVGMAGRAAYLDGGLPKWVSEKRSVSTNAPTINPTDFTVATIPGVIVDTEWLSARVGKPGIAIVDARPAEGYSGLAGHWDRLGHIPGAGNIPFFTLLAEEPPYLLKSREELSNMFLEAGAKPGDTVVVYCGTGLWGSLPYLAARHLDYDVRLYDASFQEWSATKNLSVVASGKDSGDHE